MSSQSEVSGLQRGKLGALGSTIIQVHGIKYTSFCRTGGLVTKKRRQMREKNGKSMFQSYISSQQQGHHTALPDSSHLFLKQVLHLRSRAGLRDPSWKMPSLSCLPSQPLSVQTRGMPEGAQPPRPCRYQRYPSPSQG